MLCASDMRHVPRPRPLHEVDGVFPSESKVLLGLILMRRWTGQGYAVDARMASRTGLGWARFGWVALYCTVPQCTVPRSAQSWFYSIQEISIVDDNSRNWLVTASLAVSCAPHIRDDLDMIWMCVHTISGQATQKARSIKPKLEATIGRWCIVESTLAN